MDRAPIGTIQGSDLCRRICVASAAGVIRNEPGIREFFISGKLIGLAQVNLEDVGLNVADSLARSVGSAGNRVLSQ